MNSRDYSRDSPLAIEFQRFATLTKAAYQCDCSETLLPDASRDLGTKPAYRDYCLGLSKLPKAIQNFLGSKQLRLSKSSIHTTFDLAALGRLQQTGPDLLLSNSCIKLLTYKTFDLAAPRVSTSWSSLLLLCSKLLTSLGASARRHALARLRCCQQV